MPQTNRASAEVAKFGRLASRWWDPSGPLATLHAINPLRLRYIADRVELAGSRVLDVGCGAGILAESMARLGALVTGVDLAADSIEVARQHSAANGLEVQYRVASAEDLAAAAPGSYDVVTCLELLEHVPQPDSTIAACARLLRPGGSLFLSTINRNLKSFLLAIVGAEYVLRMLPRGTHEYASLLRPAEIGRIGRASGLDVLDLTGLHYNPLSGRYWLGGNVDVNFLLHARRREPA